MQKPTTKPNEEIKESPQPYFISIQTGSDSEGRQADIFSVLVSNFFGCEIVEFDWSDGSFRVNDDSFQGDPSCVIVLQKLDSELESLEELWERLLKQYPLVPILWIVEYDDCNVPRALEDARPRVRLLRTASNCKTLVGDLLDLIEKLSGVKRVMEMKPVRNS